jgi:hypothetical protein
MANPIGLDQIALNEHALKILHGWDQLSTQMIYILMLNVLIRESVTASQEPVDVSLVMMELHASVLCALMIAMDVEHAYLKNFSLQKQACNMLYLGTP